VIRKSIRVVTKDTDKEARREENLEKRREEERHMCLHPFSSLLIADISANLLSSRKYRDCKLQWLQRRWPTVQGHLGSGKY